MLLTLKETQQVLAATKVVASFFVSVWTPRFAPRARASADVLTSPQARCASLLINLSCDHNHTPPV